MNRPCGIRLALEVFGKEVFGAFSAKVLEAAVSARRRHPPKHLTATRDSDQPGQSVSEAGNRGGTPHPRLLPPLQNPAPKSYTSSHPSALAH